MRRTEIASNDPVRSHHQLRTVTIKGRSTRIHSNNPSPLYAE